MAYPQLYECPVFSGDLKDKEFECTNCKTIIKNEFEVSKFSKLNRQQLKFVKVFVKTKDIKMVEKGSVVLC